MATDLEILKGKTFTRVVRWDTLPLVYKAITAITKAGPVAITSTTHGVPDGWDVAIVSAGGMRQLNAKNWPLRSSDFHAATKVDANIITLNDVNSSGYTTYTSGGYIVYYTPVDLSGFTARMQIRATATAANPPLVSLTSTAGDIVLDNTAKTVTVTIAAGVTAAYTFYTGVYDLELASATSVVTRLMYGDVTVVDEVTR